MQLPVMVRGMTFPVTLGNLSTQFLREEPGSQEVVFTRMEKGWSIKQKYVQIMQVFF